jgi:hypothetical protein
VEATETARPGLGVGHTCLPSQPQLSQGLPWTEASRRQGSPVSTGEGESELMRQGERRGQRSRAQATGGGEPGCVATVSPMSAVSSTSLSFTDFAFILHAIPKGEGVL